MFMHNGAIGGFHQVRRAIEQLIPASLYGERLGTTDSEAFFLLALGNGLAEDIEGALQRTIGQVLEVMDRAGVTEPFHMTAAIANGRALYALRYSNDSRSPSLYYATGSAVGITEDALAFAPGSGAVLVLSEPLDDHEADWTEIPEASFVHAREGVVEIGGFGV